MRPGGEMDLYQHLGLGKLTRAIGLPSFVTAATFKARDTVQLDAKFHDGAALVDMGEGLELVFIVKTGFADDAATLALVDTWTEVATGHYRANLSLNTEELIAAIGDQAKLSAYGELTWSKDAGATWSSSSTLAVTVENDVYKGVEGTPLGLPDPSGWLGSRALRYDMSQSLSGEQGDRARKNLGIVVVGVTVLPPSSDVFFAESPWLAGFYPQCAASHNGRVCFTRRLGEQMEAGYDGAAVWWSGTQWHIANSSDGDADGQSGWYSGEDVSSPDQVVTWLPHNAESVPPQVDPETKVPEEFVFYSPLVSGDITGATSSAIVNRIVKRNAWGGAEFAYDNGDVGGSVSVGDSVSGCPFSGMQTDYYWSISLGLLTSGRSWWLPDENGVLALREDFNPTNVSTAFLNGVEDATPTGTDRLAVVSPEGGWMALTRVFTFISNQLAALTGSFTVGGNWGFAGTSRPTSAAAANFGNSTELVTRIEAEQQRLFSSSFLKELNAPEGASASANSGSGSAGAFGGQMVRIVGSTVANAWQRYHFGDYSFGPATHFTGGNISGSQAFAVACNLIVDLVPSDRTCFYMGFFGAWNTALPSPTANVLTARGFAVRIFWSVANNRYEVTLHAHNGTTLTNSTPVALPYAFGNTVTHSFILSTNGAGQVRFYSAQQSLGRISFTPLVSVGGGPSSGLFANNALTLGLANGATAPASISSMLILDRPLVHLNQSGY